MLLPWFGPLGPQSFSVAGESFETGFTLLIHQGNRHTNSFTYPLHFTCLGEPAWEKSAPRAPWNDCLAIAIIYGAAALFYLYCMSRFSFDGWRMPIAFPIHLISLTLVVLWAHSIFNLLMFRCRHGNTAEWHTVEHKCAVLVETCQEITLGNLKRAPALMIRCGTSAGTMRLQRATCGWLLLLHCLSVLYVPPSLLGALAAIFVGAHSALLISWYGQNFPPHPLRLSLLVLLSLPASILPAVFEWYFALRSPPEWKLAIAARELPAFLKKHQLYSNTV